MIFKIKKGSHYSNNFIHKLVSFFTTSGRLSKLIEFDETAIYTDNTEDKYDVNKLFGFSNGLHHKNSYRFGWNCLDGKIKGGKCVYTIIDEHYIIQQSILEVPNKNIIGYHLWPYFGGNKTSPQDIFIKIEEIS